MLNVKREQQEGTLLLRLSGTVVEDVDFEKVVGDVSPETVLNCKEISRLNSMGVKRWIMFFEAQKAKGARLKFVEASPAVVEQLNLIRNFACGGSVESIYVPFACTNAACKKNLMGLFKVDALKASGLKLPAVKCHHCGSNAVFDDLEDEYFRFIER